MTMDDKDDQRAALMDALAHLVDASQCVNDGMLSANSNTFLGAIGRAIRVLRIVRCFQELEEV